MVLNTQTHSGNPIPTLADFLQDTYFNWVDANHTHPDATKRTLLNDCEDFHDLHLSDITASKVSAWRHEKANEAQISNATLNRIFATLRAALNHAVEVEIVSSNPVATVKLLAHDSIERVRFLSSDEEQRLRGTLAKRDAKLKAQRTRTNDWRAARHKEPLPSLKEARFGDHVTPMTLLAINTGLKRNELFQLRWSQVDLTDNVLRIGRDIPLNEEAHRVLMEWHTQTSPNWDFVFSNRNGRPFTDIKKAWKALLIEADLIDFQWNDLRHHFAVKLAKANVGLKTLQSLLGLSSFRMVEKYAQYSNSNARSAVAALS